MHEGNSCLSTDPGSYPVQTVMQQFIRDEEGQDVVEYGLLIATIAIVVLLATAAFGQNIGVWFNTLASRITTTGTK